VSLERQLKPPELCIKRQVRLIVWSKECGYQVEPDPVAMAAR
jgi:hypothetical protein